MTDINQENDDAQAPDELTVLKGRADLMGITYHPSIGAENLRKKIQDHLNDVPSTEPVAPVAPVTPVAEVVEVETEHQARRRIKKECEALVRVNVVCMNPAKKSFEGEIFTTGNSLIGTIKKYVPFGTTDGWHIPKILLSMLQERQCQIFVAGKNKNGVTMRTAKMIKEFAIEILPPLTPSELHDLAQQQAMAKRID